MKHLSTLKSLLLVLFAVLGGVNVWGETVTLTENFSSSGASSDLYNCSSSITTTSNQTNWDFVWTPDNGTVFKNGIKLGSSKKTGSVMNASMLKDIPSGTEITIRVYSAVWNTDGGKVKFTYNSSDEEKNASNAAITNTSAAYSAESFATSTDFVITKVDGVDEFAISSTAKRLLIDKVEVVYTSDPSAPVKPTAPTFSLAEGTYWSVQSLVLSTTVEGGSIYYTIDGTDPTKSETSMVYSTAISLSQTTTVNACVVVADRNFSNVVSRTYTFVPSIANTKETAYTTAEAIAIIDSHPAEQLAAEAVYVKGIISKIVTEYNSSFGNITFNISDGGTEEGDQFQFYRNIKAEGTTWTDTDIKPCVGAEVIGYGNIKKNNSTYEFEAGNYLVSYVFDKTLESVAISGTATKTSYEEGETFDFSGLTLTATYDDESTMDITSSATWTASPETLTLGTTEVTVTATYNEKTATATIPVNVTKALPTVTLDLSTDNTTTATTEKIEWVRDEFTINSVKVGQTAANNYYPGTKGQTYTSTRFYTDNSFNVIPAPFISIKKITYTATTAKYATALVKSTWTNATASADNTTVTIVPEDGTKTISAKIGATTGATSIVVTYEVVDNADITLVAQDGTDYYATFSSDKAVQFVDATVYTVDVEGTKLVLNEVTSKQVPANEGVLIKSSTNTVTVKTIEAASGISSKNLLHASSFPMKESGYMFYKLAYGDWENKADLGFYWGADNGAAFTAKAGGAYLAVPAAAGVKAFIFGELGDEETAIESVEAEAANEEIFDLSGRKVSKAVKGLYIINGKKVVK